MGKTAEAGQHRNVRGKSPRGFCNYVLEHCPLGGKTIEDRRRVSPVAIAADVIGTERIYGDENDVNRPRTVGRGTAGEYPDKKKKSSHVPAGHCFFFFRRPRIASVALSVTSRLAP